MGALPKRYFTPEEYLILEDQAAYRSQFVDGEIFALAGAEPEHNLIVIRLVAALYLRLRGRSCEVFSNDMQVRAEATGLWTYPDVVALCGEPNFDRTDRPATLLNPQVIFEVLSPSTESFDRGDKLTRYRELASLTDYVLVSSDRMMVEHHSCQSDGSWTRRTFDQPAQVLPLKVLSCEIPLAEIYERVVFSRPQPPGKD